MWSALTHSPVVGECGHVAAGVSHLVLGRFDLFRVNPPLVRTVAAIPVVITSPSVDWSWYDSNPLIRSEHVVGNDYLRANAANVFSLLRLARWMCIPFSILGGFVCCCWARQLYGPYAGIVSLALWCFSPYLLGNAALITPDAHSASLGMVACYLLWRWLRQPNWWRASLAGTALGMAELSKFTMLILYPAWPVLWLVYRLNSRQSPDGRQWIREGFMLSVLMLLSGYIVNIGYGCEGSFQRLGQYRFQTAMFTGLHLDEIPRDGGNRFADSWLGALPIPLPRNYVQGIDTQRYDFERGLSSYLCGEWADYGWWYYYLYALAVKLPLGTWCLIAIAIGATIWQRGYSASWRDESVVLTPFVVILVFVSSQTGFSVHSRYIIPALPFLFVWTGKVARVFEMRPSTRTRLVIAAAVIVALAWSIGSSLAIYPHSLSYFNELAVVLPTRADVSFPRPVCANDENKGVLSQIVNAGPCNGPRHLLDSNIDWGQDLLFLKDWLDEHCDVRLDGLAFWGSYSAPLGGIVETPLPPSSPCQQDSPNQYNDQRGPKPGWYALSVNYIYSRDQQYRYFLNFQPVAMAGYSIYIYHITIDEVNQVRRKLGLGGAQK